jgi:cytochrome P450
MSAWFSPPVPAPPERPLGKMQFLRALRADMLGIFPKSAYVEDSWSIRILGRNAVLLNNPDAIQQVLIENHTNYRLPSTAIRALRPIGRNGLAISQGEQWKRQRRIVAPELAPRAMPMLSRHIAATMQEYLVELDAHVGRPVDILVWMQSLALDISGRAMFSVAMREHAKAMRELISEYAERHVKLDVLDMILPLSLPSPRDAARWRWRARWDRLNDMIVTNRLAAEATTSQSDLFGLLRAARDPETGQGFSADELRDQMAALILAGSETTSNAMFWVLIMLAQVADEQRKVIEEVEGLALTPDSAFADLARLPQTRAVVQEALRLYPPLPILTREAIEADRVGDIDLKPRDMVMIAPWVLHRHLGLWDRPAAFDPSRFLPGAPAPSRFSYLPFGVGPRVCVGAQFALAEATLAVASILQRFELVPTEDRPILPKAYMGLVPDHPPQFRLQRRSQV